MIRSILISIFILSALTNPSSLKIQENKEPRLGFHVARGDASHLEAVRAAGGQFAVVVFSWANIEPEPNYLYWEKPDATLRAAEFYNLEVIARLDQPPDWALDDQTPTPWNLEAYAHFVQQVTERYGDRLAGIILWNEPNLSLEWNDQPPDAVAYAEMLKATYPLAKATAPDLPVLMAGLASTEGEGDWAINDLDYLQDLYQAGAADYFDLLAAHTYGFGRPPSDEPEKFRPNFRRLELYREIMLAHNEGDKSIWITEMGWMTWTPDPRHEWQVVSPETQAEYISQAITLAQNNYPWVERMTLWELNTERDQYGYALWQGPEQSSLAYEMLVTTCATRSTQCESSPADDLARPSASSIEILAPDATIRLGDRDMLHPHWIHLHQGNHLVWEGEFFLRRDQIMQNYDLALETMQVDQATNQLILNGTKLAYLHPRPDPNPISSWVTQRFPVPPELLQPGVNYLSLKMAIRNPARQYMGGRRENMQFRNVRLTTSLSPPMEKALFHNQNWQAQPSPDGWGETNRLRIGLAGDIWVTGIQTGQLWHGSSSQNGFYALFSSPALTLTNEANNRPDLVFNDLLPLSEGELTATDQGLYWRDRDQKEWQFVEGTPIDYAYVVHHVGSYLWAGFEQEGLWRAESPSGPWQKLPFPIPTVTDMTPTYQTLFSLFPDRLYVTTQTEIFYQERLGDHWQQLELPGLSQEELEEIGENPDDQFKPRVFVSDREQPIIRHQDRLWLQDGSEWVLLGPEKVHGKSFTTLNCCGLGTLIGTHQAGVWQFNEDWHRLDQDFFNTTDITELEQVGQTFYAAGDRGLFQSNGGDQWQKVPGLPATITDLIFDPTTPTRWLAGTPAGIYRSEDRGQSWEAVSPPWRVWDMTFDAEGRLFVGRSQGIVWTDHLDADPIEWEIGTDMSKVYFLSLNPHPTEAQIFWAGTWGNNIAISEDRGETLRPIHHGLETLSVLDLLWHPRRPGQRTAATFEGLYRTDNGGEQWFLLPGPLAQQTVYDLFQAEDGMIWAGATNGLWSSHDMGTQWQTAPNFPSVTVLRIDQVHQQWFPQWLWAGTERAGLWISPDGGENWHFAGLEGRTIYQLLFDTHSPPQLVAATDQGIFTIPLQP